MYACLGHYIIKESIYSQEQIPEPYKKTILMSLEGNSLEKIIVSQSITLGTVKSTSYFEPQSLSLVCQEQEWPDGPNLIWPDHISSPCDLLP